MTVSIKEIFEKVGLEPSKPVNWGEPFSADYSGVYVISLTDDINKDSCKYPFEIDNEVFNNWINKATNLTIDGRKVTRKEQVQDYLKQFWKPNEHILYIGQTSSKSKSIQKRVGEYYSHKVGNSGSHSGGYWLKLLSNLNDCNVYFAKCKNPKNTEFKMIMYFAEMYSGKSFYEMDNIALNLPFANLKVDVEKEHNIKKSTNKNKK